MVLSFFAAMLIAALAGMGVGGGGLLVIYLTLVTDMETTSAQGVNLLFFIVSALAALPVHLFVKKRRVPIRKILLLTAIALPGAMLGASMTHKLPKKLMRRIFGGFLCLCGTLSLLRCLKSAKEDRGSGAKKKKIP